MMEAATAQLRATGIEAQALKPGAGLPALTLPDATGPLVIVFYRGGWCPYCNLEAAKAFGIAFTMSPELVELYSQVGNDLPTLNGNGQWAMGAADPRDLPDRRHGPCFAGAC
jgi:thiol-disulfide isomerase/thioredoxin